MSVQSIETEPENDVMAELLASLSKCVELLGKLKLHTVVQGMQVPIKQGQKVVHKNVS